MDNEGTCPQLCSAATIEKTPHKEDAMPLTTTTELDSDRSMPPHPAPSSGSECQLFTPSDAPPPGFFFLSDLTPSQLVSSFLKPQSSKLSLNSFFHKDKHSSPRSSPSPSTMTQERTTTPRSDVKPNVANARDPQDCASSTNTSTRNSVLMEKQHDPPTKLQSTSALSGPDLEKQAMPDITETWAPSRSEWLIMIAMAVSSLTVALDATILVPVLPDLARALNGTATQAFWAGTSYLLASAVVQPFIAALSDIFGRREATLSSLALFGISSIVCAVSQDFTTLLVGRALQGIGGGGIISQAQIVYADIVPLRQRPRYFALVLAAWAVGTMFGPITGGAFVQEASNWRWCFFINLPICAIALALVYFFLSLTTPYRTLAQKLRLVDWTGGFLFIASLTSFLVAISWGGAIYAWSSWYTLVPLILGAFGTVATIYYESCLAPHPFLNKSLFHNTSAIATYLSALFQGLVLFMILYYVSFYFSSAKLHTAVYVGIDLFPATFLLLPGSIICSQLITRFGVYRPFIWAGWSISTLGSGMAIHWSTSTSKTYWASTLCVLGIGLGITLSCINFAVQASATPATSGAAAAAMYAFMRSLGMALGVAIGGTIFQNLMKQRLQHYNLDTMIAADAEAYVVAVLRGLPDDPDDTLKIMVQDSYVHGFRGVFIAVTALCASALLGSLVVKHYSLDNILESKFVARKVKGDTEGGWCLK